MIVYRLLFWLPAVVAVYGLRVSWEFGLLSRPLVSFGLVLLAITLQGVGGQFSRALWAIGLVGNVALAIYFHLNVRRGA